MAKVNEDPQYLRNRLEDLHGEFLALERAAMVLADHNVKLRTFLARMLDGGDLADQVPDPVKAIAANLVSMERACGG